MRLFKPVLIFSLSLLLTVLFAPAIARADDDDQVEDYDVTARVLRVSLINGGVSIKRHDSDQWEPARLNAPLVEGDTLTTGTDGRAEIQIDSRNFLRVAPDSVLRIATLRDDGIALSLAQGIVTLRLADFERDREFFEIDAPNTTIAAESEGVYRVDADSKARVQVTVRHGGKARVYSETAGFTVRDGHTGTFTFDSTDPAGDWQTGYAQASDSWDQWVDQRETYLAGRLKYDQAGRYYDADIWGAEDLDAYGSWSYVDSYGWMWRPTITIINNYSDWAPYRYGSWVWCSPYGWTWIADEPFGWAPYHYGRWVYYNNYWAWCPHSFYGRHRSWWRPALVAFFSFDFDFGSNYCWYPLTYHQRDPRSSYFHGRDRLTPMRRDEIADLHRLNPAYLRAVTSVPARDFSNRAARPQAAKGELARRAIEGEPLRGDLPVRPVAVAGTADRSGRPIPGASTLRPTGAAARTPGAALDNELRHSRIFNGRDPVSNRNSNDPARSSEVRPTGAVTRPAPSSNPTVDRGTDFNPPSGSPARPTRSRDPRSVGDPNDAPGSRDRNPEAQPVEQPTRPARSNPNEPVKRDRVERPEPTERIARPAGRSESPSPRAGSESPRPASPPPQRSEPPSRSYEPPPQRSEPPPSRSEPPPQRSEPPPSRSEPPPSRSEPPPSRSEPPPSRSEPPPSRSEPPPQRSQPPAERSESSRSSDRSSRSESSRSSSEASSRASRKGDQ